MQLEEELQFLQACEQEMDELVCLPVPQRHPETCECELCVSTRICLNEARAAYEKERRALA